MYGGSCHWQLAASASKSRKARAGKPPVARIECGAGMLQVTHWAIVAVYLALPAVALVWSIWQRARGRRGALGGLILTTIAGVVLSGALSLIYAAASGGKVVWTQILIGAYFAIGMLLLLKGFDWGVRMGLRKLLAIRKRSEEENLSGWLIVRIFIASVLRVAIVSAVALPYVMSSVMTYRPKVHPADDPKRQLGFDYQRVQFTATDGVKLVGWWIPAQGGRTSKAAHDTVLVCHGLAANKSNQLLMARQLVPGGFNVLAFDLRAHGESGGQLTTYGALEGRDVLGAVRWVRKEHPDESQRIFGAGASMGAVALITAATDDSDEGRAIEAIAAYAAYDSLPGLTRSITKEYFLPPLGWLLIHVGVPLASAQTGVDLSHFDPAQRVSELWPRPLLLIHGEQDRIDHNDILSNEGAARVVLRFFREARQVPII